MSLTKYSLRFRFVRFLRVVLFGSEDGCFCKRRDDRAWEVPPG